jgi:hypothetical protein
MLTLTGKFRQSSEMQIGKEGEPKRPFVKLWVEVENERENGVSDLSIEELLVPADKVSKLPQKGENISIFVRAYARGRDVAYSAIALASGTFPHEPSAKLLKA